MRKLPKAMNLIKVAPTSFDLLDSDLKQEGVDSRQHFDVSKKGRTSKTLDCEIHGKRVNENNNA